MNIRQYLEKSPLVFDGAMGTYYAALKHSAGKCELANLNDRETILKIHNEYIQAGSKAIKTNTFGANKISLEAEFSQVKKVIQEGYKIAEEAAKDKGVFVFADIGPIPAYEKENLIKDYTDIIDEFLQLGAENFLFETFDSLEVLPKLVQYIKNKNPQAYIITSLAVSPEGFTRLGFSGEKLFNTLKTLKEIDAVGFNCISGPYHLFQYIKKMNIQNKTVSIMPNAGYPTVINNRTFFDGSEEYFAKQMLETARLGVKILGGCCGTTPKHILSTVKALKDFSASDIENSTQIQISENTKEEKQSILIEKMNKGEKIIAVELDPPLDTEVDFFMEGAKRLKKAGANAVTIADCPIARARMDSSLLACKLKRELDITPIPHMTCRDRNINATKALLLGMSMEGVNNVLVVTGDPIPSAQRDEIKAMFSFNSAILANHISTLNETVFKNPFNICAALNVNAVNFEHQLNHAQKKIENGVTTLFTQPILTQKAFENLKLAKNTLNAKIMGGIIPIVSYRNACFMNNEISGINVADEIIEMYKDLSKEEAAELAVKISAQIAEKISAYVDGYYLITPFKRVEIIEKIIEKII